MSSSVVSGQAPEVDAYAECHASVADIPNSEKLALLKMRYGNDLAKACVALGRTIGWEEPGPSAWRSLFRRKWITRDYSFRNAPRGVLALTWLGLQRQRELAHAMARTSNLHFMLETTDSRYSVTVRCTCGWSASLSKNQGHINTGQLRAYGVHTDAVAKGIWKKPRPVDEMLDDIFARMDAARSAPTVPAQEPAQPHEQEHADERERIDAS